MISLSFNLQLFNFKEVKTCLGSLCEITCDMSINPTYFYVLARICQSIQRLIIINDGIKANDGIVQLIEVQNLKYFKWTDDTLMDFYELNHLNDHELDIVMKELYEEIFLTLEKKTNTLNYLIINLEDYCYYDLFLPINISKFHNLKTLQIKPHYLEFEHQMKSSCYQNLETLHVCQIKFTTIIGVIKNSGGHLRKILVDYLDNVNYNKNYCQESLLLIRTVYENCPLIEYLSLAFSRTTIHFVEFENLLKACRMLKTLLLHITISSYTPKSFEEESREKLSSVLIKSAPENLREIRLMEMEFPLETFDAFLDNWRGRTPLSIIASVPLYQKEEFMKILIKYMDDGVIKKFKCGSMWDIYFGNYLSD